MGRIDVMIDIEMMGGGKDAAVASIAACRFDRFGPAPSFEDVKRDGFSCAVRRQSCFNVGLTADGGTIDWWLEQSEVARRALLENQIPLRDALSKLRKYLLNQVDGDAKRLLVWAKPAAGDLVVLDSAYQAIDSISPWIFKNRRCLSTLKHELAPAVSRWPSDDLPKDLKHVAIWDVYDQILDAQAVCAVLARLLPAA